MPDALKIPAAEGPLWALWLDYRNRVWAEINETFRARLRRENPKILFFSNTQYAYENAMLGTDFQYVHEDVVLSESVALNSRQMSEKLVLGHAMAQGRPVWNYIGTFVSGEDYTGLKPASVISPLIAATLAHGACPWIVDGFDLGQTDANARKEMSRLLSWRAEHPELFSAAPWAEVGSIISLRSRNLLHRPLIPPHVAALQVSGTPVIALRDDKLTDRALKPFRVLALETSACLNEDAATAVAKWVRGGGLLVATSDTGTFDELGQPRPESPLWKRFGASKAPTGNLTVRRGKVIVPAPNRFTRAASEAALPYSFLDAASHGVEVLAYRNPGSLIYTSCATKPEAQPSRSPCPKCSSPVAPRNCLLQGQTNPVTFNAVSIDNNYC